MSSHYSLSLESGVFRRVVEGGMVEQQQLVHSRNHGIIASVVRVRNISSKAVPIRLTTGANSLNQGSNYFE